MKTLAIFPALLLFICLCNFESKAQHVRNYKIGFYIDTSGRKHEGLIDFGVSFGGETYDKLNFKTDDSAKNQKVPIATLKSVIIQSSRVPDTLIVLTETDTITYARSLYFGQFCFATPNTRIYSRQRIMTQNSGGGMMSIGTPGTNISTPRGIVHIAGTPGTMNVGPFGSTEYTVTQYMFEIDGSLTLPIARYNYKEVLEKAFADDPDLVKKIKNKTLKFQQIQEIMDRYQNRNNLTKQK